MPDPATRVPASALPADQASGLRRLFEAAVPQCTLVLIPALRSPIAAAALATRARQCAALQGPTLVVDAARTQVAVALNLKLRYDLDHALTGDCDLAEACVRADEHLWVLPAARALDHAVTDAAQARRAANAVEALAGDMRHVMIVLPASRASWLTHLPAALRSGAALIPVANGGETSAAVLTAVRQGISEAQIDTFHLLFLGMGEAAAGRLLSGMAAIAQRHFGAKLQAAPPVVAVPWMPVPGGSEHRPVEIVF